MREVIAALVCATFIHAAPAWGQMSEEGLKALGTQVGRVTANYDFCDERDLASEIRNRFMEVTRHCTTDPGALNATQEALQFAYKQRTDEYAASGGTCNADFKGMYGAALGILDEAYSSC